MKCVVIEAVKVQWPVHRSVGMTVGRLAYSLRALYTNMEQQILVQIRTLRATDTK